MAFELGISHDDLERIVALFKEGGQAAESMASGVEKVNASIRSASSGSSQTLGERNVAQAKNPMDQDGGSGYSGPQSEVRAMRGGRSMSLEPYDYEGPRQKLERYRALSEIASTKGDVNLTKDWEDRVKRAETAVKRLDRDPDQARLDMLMTSRILPGNVLSPLVGRLLATGQHLATPEGAEMAAKGLSSLGVGLAKDLAPAIMEAAKAAIPVIATAGSVATGIGTLVGIAEAGAASMHGRNNAFYTLGGSTSDVTSAIGLGGEGAEQRAMQLGDRLREGSIGASYLRSMGSEYRGRNTNYAGNYVRSLDALRGIDDVQERIRVARETGLSEDLWTADLSDASYARRKMRESVAGTPGEREREAEYREQKDELSAAGGWVIRGLSGAAMQTLLDPTGLRSAIDRFTGGNKRTRSKTRPNSGGWENVDPAPGNGPRTLNGDISQAIPIGWRGQAINSVIDNQSWMVGAFHP